jgi:hypothetical protein
MIEKGVRAVKERRFGRAGVREFTPQPARALACALRVRQWRHADCSLAAAMRRHASLCISLVALVATGAAAAPQLRWERAAVPWPGDAVHALALDPANGLLALGGERGVRVVGPRGVLDVPRGPVRDLAFLPGGVLLVATDDGVHRIEPDGRSTREALAPGEEERRVARVAAHASGLAAAATEAGVLLRDVAGRWSRRSELPRAPATLVALRSDGADVELWCVLAGALWLSVFPAQAPEESGSVRRVPLPEGGSVGAPLDAVFDRPDAEVALLLPTGFAVRDAAGGWSMLRTAWPPGSTPTRAGVARGQVAVATDAGLLLAPALAGPWQRAASPVGTAPALALAASGDELVVATHREVLRADGEELPLPPAPPQPLPPQGPEIQAVQRVALDYLELDPERAHGLRRRAERRGWLPILSLRAGHERDRASSHGWDQSFTSGDTRDLYDAGRARNDDYSFDVTVAWDLGDTVFNADEVDVSRELRSVVALRDDVLDEVTQLYFERRRAIEQLSALAPGDPQAGPLRLRAAELAAGIDAWTGGWFTRALPGPVTP